MTEKQETPLAAPDREQRRREIAYQLWEAEGRPEGRAEEHWSIAGALLQDWEKQASAQEAPAWLRKGSVEPATPELNTPSAIDELRERVKKRVA